MRVTLDIQPALAQGGGIGRYTRELLRHLPDAAPDLDFSAFFFDFNRRGLPFPPPPARTLRPCRWCPGRIAQQLWKRLHAPPYPFFAGPADLYFFPNFIRPPMGRSRARTVVAIHDVSFLRLPETTEPKNLAWLRAGIAQSAKSADAIVTDSRFSASEIAETLSVPPSKIHPVLLGVAPPPPAPDPGDAARRRTRLGLLRPYLLMVSTIEPRKNIPFLVKVFEALRSFDGDLALVGGLGWKTGPILDAIARSPASSRIRLLSHIPDPDLDAVYAGASAFVFPSLYEGFGLPPLEAMARGTPVVAARNSSLPEVLGDAPLWIDGWDPAHWAASIQALLDSHSDLARLRAAGPLQASRFTWSSTAASTAALFRSLL